MNRKRTDANQTEIVKALRKAGYSVLSLAPMGKGCPDLLVGKYGRNWLLEVKDGSKSPSERKLTPDQVQFHTDWKGSVALVTDALGAIAKLENSYP